MRRSRLSTAALLKMSLVSVQEIWWGPEESDLAIRIAQKAFPKGAVMSCKMCDYQAEVTTRDIAEYLTGWPRHCGHRLEIDDIT